MLDVLVVQNDARDPPDHFEAAFRASGLAWAVVHAYAGEPLPETTRRVRSVVLLGGAPAAYDPPPFLRDVARFARHAHAAGTPLLGVCLGAQLLAHELGGRAFRAPAPEVGFVDVTPAPVEDPVLAAFGGGARRVFAWHHDTYDLPPGAVRLASSSAFREQAFRLGEATYGLQFHPESSARAIVEAMEEDAEGLAELGIDTAAIAREAPLRDAEQARLARALVQGFAAVVEARRPV